MKRKMFLSLILMVLVSLAMTSSKVQAAELSNLETLQKVEIVTPAGDYKTGDTITFKATFEKDIAGITTTESLKISFSESNIEREIISGTDVNNTITYQYTIKESDKGTLIFKMYSIRAITSSNGSVETDGFDNNVTIKANVATTPVPTPTPEPTEDWTDFSKAKVEFYWGSGIINAKLSGIKTQDKHTYDIYYSTNKDSLSIETKDTLNSFLKVKDQEYLNARLSNDFLALNKTYYYIIVESFNGTKKVVKEATAIERPALPSIGNRLEIYMYDEGSCSPYQEVYSSSKHNRKINYKIGVVNDTDILRTFKTNEAKGFKDLLKYAKSAEYLTTGTVDTNNKNNFNPVDKITVKEDVYYFAYLVLDDENGKYIPVEDVQIYEKGSGNTLIHFAFGSMNVPDEEPEKTDGKKDQTTATGKIPQTGATPIAIAIASIIVVSGVTFLVKYNKYKDIK